MVTLKNRTFHLMVGSIISNDDDNKTVIQFSIKNEAGQYESLSDYRSFMEGVSGAANPAKITIEGVSLKSVFGEQIPTEGSLMLVTGDVNHDDSTTSQLKFGVSNLRLAERTLVSRDLAESTSNGIRETIELTHQNILSWINNSRQDPSAIATVVLAEEWCNHIGGLSSDFDISEVNPEVLDYINEIHFNSPELKDAYISGIRDAVGYMEHMEIDIELKQQFLDGFNKPSKSKPKL